MALQTAKDNKIMLTQDGYQTLLEEYKDLTEVQRPEIVEQIQTARELGDLSENGMYTVAREKQSFVEGRIREIEDIMKRVEVVEELNQSSENAIVQVGSKVTLEMPQQEVEYHIVGAEEVSFEKNKISHESPLGGALIGKKVGDNVQYDAPIGKITYKIIDIK